MKNITTEIELTEMAEAAIMQTICDSSTPDARKEYVVEGILLSLKLHALRVVTLNEAATVIENEMEAINVQGI